LSHYYQYPYYQKHLLFFHFFYIVVMEEFLGEYIINLAKENLQVAVLRGKLKLDNVQLDGDLIGSHVLGAVGLSGT